MNLVSKGKNLYLCTAVLMFFSVPPSFVQPPLPLSLPVHMSAVPDSWHFLPLSQAELTPLFSNSSPFSFSQSLLMVSPSNQASRANLKASFGPYSVLQPLSDLVLPLSVPLTTSLLSEHVEREMDQEGQERFRVRVLFHTSGDGSNQNTCVTLHAFKETEELKGSCSTQPPLGFCIVTLTLPSDWFKDQHTGQSHHGLNKWFRYIQNHHHVQKQHRHKSHKHQWNPIRNQVQLYLSYTSRASRQLTVRGCAEDRISQSQQQLFYIKAVSLRDQKNNQQNGTKEEEFCLNGQKEEELNLDSHVLICYHRGPVLIGQPIRVSVNVRANFSAELVVVRLKVRKGLVLMVAQRTLTSDLWAVTLERTQSSQHDVVSILCRKHNQFKQTHNSTLLQQMACLSINGLRRSFGIAISVSVNWWVEYGGRSNHPSPHGVAVSIFSFTDRHISGIAPITKSNVIVNTAILTNQPVSLSVIVLAVGHDGKVFDVTAAVTCHSTNENTIKVSTDCSTLFVDGSESGLGNTCAVVEFHLGALSGSVCLQVWVPSVPLRVSLVDPVLNAIDGWKHFTGKGCEPVYQRTSVQVLTQFTAQDSHSQTTDLLRSSDWFVDVTELVSDWLRVEDLHVASLGHQNILIGLQPGRTSVYVVSEQWDGVLGSCEVIVTSDSVSTGDLSLQVVSGLGMSVMASPTHPSVVTTTVTAHNILHDQYQEASTCIWLQFSDDTAALLSSFSDIPYSHRLTSLAETVVVVTPGHSQRIFAQGDGGGPLLLAELVVSSCVEQPIIFNALTEAQRERTEGGAGGVGTRILARGSGWIRVNLGLGFLESAGDKDEEGEQFEYDLVDALVESDGDIYASNLETRESENVNGVNNFDKVSKRNQKDASKWGQTNRNKLERAVLKQSQEESSVYFSPKQEEGGDGWMKEREEERPGAGEVEVGVGAVLSLCSLFAVLFLANCLPCILRDKRKRKTQERDIEIHRCTTETTGEVQMKKCRGVEEDRHR
ncbi:transmembrane protein 132C [Thalassophryne amazonica]|uniref:transmembrane protein 132C n=1 Tax=Thalassophryne amazonica TaxID=390379 RepID=UPI0014715D04|nr:transmembrane protein 132C [Thalassophryne amazonica]